MTFCSRHPSAIVLNRKISITDSTSSPSVTTQVKGKLAPAGEGLKNHRPWEGGF